MPSFPTIVGAMLVLTMPALLPAAATAQATWSGYQIGAEDQIEVRIYNQNDTVVKTRVKSDGTITLPFIGRIRAEGQTSQALASAIEARLKAAGIFNSPIVNVEIVTYAARTVTLFGEFATPGVYPLDRPLMLSEMVARVGGLRNGAGDTVVLRRGGVVERHSLSAIARGEKRDIPLQANDAVYAAPATVYFIYGQVGNAGVYPILPAMSIRQALARAGGPTLAGSEKRITLYREGREIDADLTAPIQPDDVLFVRERVF